MNVQRSQLYVAAMQSAITSQEPTAASVLKDTSLQPMGGLVSVSFTFVRSAAHQLSGCDSPHKDRKQLLGSALTSNVSWM